MRRHVVRWVRESVECAQVPRRHARRRGRVLAGCMGVCGVGRACFGVRTLTQGGVGSAPGVHGRLRRLLHRHGIHLHCVSPFLPWICCGVAHGCVTATRIDRYDPIFQSIVLAFVAPISTLIGTSSVLYGDQVRSARAFRRCACTRARSLGDHQASSFSAVTLASWVVLSMGIPVYAALTQGRRVPHGATGAACRRYCLGKKRAGGSGTNTSASDGASERLIHGA